MSNDAKAERLNDEVTRLRAEIQRLTWANIALTTKLEQSAMRVVSLSEKLAEIRTPQPPAKPSRFEPTGGRA